MKTIYRIDDWEFDELVFKTKFISRRQDITDIKKFQRTDMFWVEIFCNGTDTGSVAIDPDFENPEKFSISKNWCEIERAQFHKIKDRVSRWFTAQPEYQQQVDWIKQILERIS